ncbi:aldo/keto reductase [Actinomadura bangladeshensis]|uniref:Aldo/keto reductase n=1 Tax=Actinomadura bangladeshensis TaxID=453573 RepID=A0A4R4PCM4_9ACTN|nr:aldo/keto reductase [Actinomadura bangladeshensis]TDC20381.1 aldo/keto reductase [Actinomadura bangladeshensis]
MEYRVLGRTGVRVSPFCLGAMMFGAWGADLAESRRIIDVALDAGINMIDTADVYSQGESEEIVGEVLGRRRDDIVLATKFHNRMGPGPNQRGNSARWLIRACEDSLRRLRTDHIDVYQIHRPDPDTALDETLTALGRLVDQGKVRYIGTSTFPASTLVEAQWLAEVRHLPRIVTEQPPYSLLSRGVEADVLSTCRRYRVGVLVWSPLSGGWLSGKWRADGRELQSSRADRVPGRYDMTLPHNQRKLEAVEELAKLAEGAGISLLHMALAFVLRNPAVTAAIVGPRTVEHLTGQLGALDVTLTDDVLDRIDEIVTPGTNFGWSDVWAPPMIAEPALRRRPVAP